MNNEYAQLMTADELLRWQPPNKRSELIKGRLVVREPAGYRHGEIAARIAKLIAIHVDDNALGRVFAAETGFKLASDPDTVRAPDVAFIAQHRIPTPSPIGFAGMAPDLVVEVLSPDDRPGAVLAKTADWISAGCQLVWVVDPERSLARVYRSDGSNLTVGLQQTLDGEAVLPGFICSLSEILGPEHQP